MRPLTKVSSPSAPPPSAFACAPDVGSAAPTPAATPAFSTLRRARPFGCSSSFLLIVHSLPVHVSMKYSLAFEFSHVREARGVSPGTPRARTRLRIQNVARGCRRDQIVRVGLQQVTRSDRVCCGGRNRRDVPAMTDVALRQRQARV